MNKKEAAAILTIAVAAIPNLQNKDIASTAAAWAVLMPDVDYKTGRIAVTRILREKKISTLPLPGEIIEVAKELNRSKSDAPTAIDAWHEVSKKINPYKATKWSHPAIQKAVARVGTAAICSGEFNIATRFMTIYDQLVRREIIDKENTIAIQITGQNISFLGSGVS